MRSCRAITCGSAKTCDRSLIGPHGTLARSRISIHSAVVRITVAWRISGISTSRLATRALLVAKRSSSAHSAWPASSANLRNCPSLPTVRMKSPSAVGKSWYGTMFGCALPSRRGGLPVVR
ncbi:hypothetical protein D9M71_704610 [compost metagenome]